MDAQLRFGYTRTIARVGATLLVCLGIAVLVGWLTDIEFLMTVLPGRITMKPNTASGFLFLGATLLLSMWPNEQKNIRGVGMFLSVLVIAIGALTLVEYLFHADLRIDQLLFQDHTQFPYPGRMAHITAINFCICGIAGFLLCLSEEQAFIPQILAVFTGLSATLAIIGYLYGVPLLYGSIQYSSMALHTGFGFLVFSLSTILCRSEVGLMSVIMSDQTGGWISRKLLPIAMLVPVVLGAVTTHTRFFNYDWRLGVAMLIVIQIILFAALIWTLARMVNQSEEERSEAGEALQESERQLQQSQKIEAIGLLAGGVAHDFNNALGVMIGYAELLQLKLPAEDPMHRQAREIMKAGQRAASLTRQLLAFSRKQLVQPIVLNLNSVISDMEKMLRRLIGEDIEIVFKAAPDLGKVTIDPSQIDQILMNLAVNARDAMPFGGKISIETANVELDEISRTQRFQVKPGPYVMLSVSDNGSGIKKELLDHIFEPFFTTKEAGKGTGLGLSTVYGIIKQNNGYIWVYSEPGKGTAFKIYLPRNADTAEVQKIETMPAVAAGGTETILLVEDEEGLRTLARTCLESRGYTVLEASDAPSAFQLVQKHQNEIHLLLTDVILPGMSGRELADKMVVQRRGIKVLYMSGYTNDLIAQHGILDRNTLLLEKPFTLHSLLIKVHQAIHRESAKAAGAN